MNGDRRETVLFSMAMAILLVVIFAFFTVFILRERSYRRFTAEYSAYRVLSARLETMEMNLPENRTLDDERILGFGMYRSDGTALKVSGTAPAAYPSRYCATRRAFVEYGQASIRIFRPLGFFLGMGPGLRPDFPGAPADDRAASGFLPPPVPRDPPRGMMMGGRGPPGNHQLPEDEPGNYVFIEYGTPELARLGSLDYALIAFSFVALVAIFFLTVRLYRKNAAYRRKEEENRQLVELGQAARTLAHEIKNPLGVIAVQCATLRKTVPDARLHGVDVISEEVKRLVVLTDRVRDYLRNSAGNPESIELNAFVAEFARRWNGRVRFEGAGEPVVISIDPARFRSVIENLVQNAFESLGDGDGLADASGSPAGGEAVSPPSVSSGEGGDAAVLIRLGADRSTASIAVLDRGCGIGADQVERIFTPFFTTKVKGSGIGLAMSRQFMRRVGGDVTYAPRPGGGSVFTIVVRRTAGKRG